MRPALHAEWTKLRTVAGPGWLLLAVVVTTVGMGAAAGAGFACPGSQCDVDVVKLSLIGVRLSQVVVAVLAVLVIGGEYSTGMIRTTLTAMPRRTVVLAAKATTVTALVLVAGAVAALGSIVAGRLILPGSGFTAARGFPPLSPADGPTLRAAAGTALYLALIALLSLGAAALVRNSAAAIGLVLGLLYVFPILAGVVTDPDWVRRLQQISPSNAGLAIQDTVGLAGQPLSPWAGLGVLAVWAVAAAVAGGLTLQFRDVR
jgi:ABC-2 type transport system permease protein